MFENILLIYFIVAFVVWFSITILQKVLRKLNHELANHFWFEWTFVLAYGWFFVPIVIGLCYLLHKVNELIDNIIDLIVDKIKKEMICYLVAIVVWLIFLVVREIYLRINDYDRKYDITLGYAFVAIIIHSLFWPISFSYFIIVKRQQYKIEMEFLIKDIIE